MKRIDGANAQTNKFGSGKPGFKESAPYTALTPTFMDMVQEEIARAIELSGDTLDAGDYEQLYNAIAVLNRRAVVELPANVSIFGAEAKANQHPSSPGNAWKQILSAPTNDNTYVRFLVGAGNAGAWAITWNAVWNPGSAQQNWSRDQNGLNSTIVWNDGTTLRYEAKAAGASAWTSWDLDAGVAVDDLTVNDDAIVSGDLTVNGASLLQDTEVDGTLTLTGELTYDAPKGRTRAVNIFRGTGAGFSFAGHGELLSLVPNGIYLIPIDFLPPGAVMNGMRFRVGGVGGIAQYTIRLMRRHAVNFSASIGTLGFTYTQIDSQTQTAPDPPYATENGLNWGALAVNYNEDYIVSIMCDGVSPNDLLVSAINIDYNDPGERY